jgi:hypothetical protein
MPNHFGQSGCGTITKELPLFDKRQKNTLQGSFEKFDRENPIVWELFCNFTHELIRAGRTRYSADAILHRIRWETAVKTKDEMFKLNNNHAVFYGEKFMNTFPIYRGFFEQRKTGVK